MSKKKIPEDVEALAQELAKHIKAEEDLGALSRHLKKLMVEAALGVEMEQHLGYGKEFKGYHSGNSRNDYSSKRLIGDHGEVEIRTPRDRNGTFEPQING